MEMHIATLLPGWQEVSRIRGTHGNGMRARGPQ